MKQIKIRIYKKFNLTPIWIGMFCMFFSFAQQNDLSQKAQELVYSNPEESLKIANHLLKTSQNAEEKAVAYLLIAKSHLIKGNYEEVITNIFDENNLSETLSIKTQIELNLLKSQILRLLYLDQQSQSYLQKVEKLVEETPNSINVDSVLWLINLEKIKTDVERRNNSKALKLINESENKYSDFLNSNKHLKRALYLTKAKSFNNLANYDSAGVYIEKSLNLLNKNGTKDLYQKAITYKELGALELQQKEFGKCEKSLLTAFNSAKSIGNLTLLMEVNRDLSISYLASGDNEKHKYYNDKYIALNTEVESNEQKAVNTLYTLLSNHNETEVLKSKQNQNKNLYLLIASLCGILFAGGYIILKGIGRKKRLNEIIKYLEIVRKNDNNTKPINKSKPKGIVIPKETEKSILDKLKRFEASAKYLNKDMSLAVLAGQFETNTKYLSGVINKHYDDNFNTFINKLRVNYIIDKLKNEPNYINYKISVLAEECGYSSHSSFATVFKSIVGMSPVVFIKHIQKERELLKRKGTN